MNARDEILSRVRKATAGVQAPEIPRAYAQTSPTPDLLTLFAERVADYRAIVHQVPATDLATTVRQVLAVRNATRIAVPDGLPPGWTTGVTALSDTPPLTPADLKDCDGVITTCAVAVAETGTIVLDAGPGQGRRALSLVPDYHLCVVDAAKIAGTVPEATARLDPRRPQTWISGPSATSDIELHRVEGVHGPRTLEVIIAT
ncbi:LutC/YkgG family protein [Actinomadura hibisca]|uniref:LutC/YkgG family protein n=1 Tax=Actinomadura hibisca TaxID=68565 RepID=UPI0008356C8A|nr:LUD domain-containing protein [Actinomadura hibisca]